jgi:hypothetical protein
VGGRQSTGEHVTGVGRVQALGGVGAAIAGSPRRAGAENGVRGAGAVSPSDCARRGIDHQQDDVAARPPADVRDDALALTARHATAAPAPTPGPCTARGATVRTAETPAGNCPIHRALRRRETPAVVRLRRLVPEGEDARLPRPRRRNRIASWMSRQARCGIGAISPAHLRAQDEAMRGKRMADHIRGFPRAATGKRAPDPGASWSKPKAGRDDRRRAARIGMGPRSEHCRRWPRREIDLPHIVYRTRFVVAGRRVRRFDEAVQLGADSAPLAVVPQGQHEGLACKTAGRPRPVDTLTTRSPGKKAERGRGTMAMSSGCTRSATDDC